jgi:hypothetical protein
MQTAEQLGNVTQMHRRILDTLRNDAEPLWSSVALRTCLDELRESVITSAAHVRVHDAWTDGSEAFCVVYTPPWGTDERVGLRREATDKLFMLYSLTHVAYLAHVESVDYVPPVDPRPDPVAFGIAVAVWDIGEPGHDVLSPADATGVRWWGTGV